MTKSRRHLVLDEHGVTLIELIAVIIVLGILAAIAMPRIGDLDIFKTRGFYDKVGSTLRYAQKAAVASGCDVEVTSAANQLTLLQRHDCSSPTSAFDQPVPIPGESDSPNLVTAPSGTALSATPSTFVFDSLGRAVDPGTGNPIAANVTVQVGAQSVTVVGDTGYVDAQ